MPRAILYGVIGGLILTVLTVLNTILPFVTGITPGTMIGFLTHAYTEGSNLSLPVLRGASWYLIVNVCNVLIVAGLTYGVFRKNRWSVILLFSYGVIYLLLNLIMMFSGALWLALNVIITVVILIAILRGMRGIFVFHKDYL